MFGGVDMKFDNKIFCENVRTLRILNGYNKYEMSIQANIYYQYYCAIENGDVVPNFRAVISIANALNMDIEHLLSIPSSPEKDYLISEIVTILSKTHDEKLLNIFYSMINLLKTWVDNE